MVTFDLQDGSVATPTMSNVNAGLIAAPADPARPGYTFGGWFKEAACANQWNFGSDTVSGDITLYAKWIPVITIATQPAAGTTVTAGAISSSLTCEATVSGSGTPAYLWYQCDNAAKDNPVFTGDNDAAFNIPSALTPGTYYYFCRVSAAGAVDVDSNAVMVVVSLSYALTITARTWRQYHHRYQRKL